MRLLLRQCETCEKRTAEDEIAGDWVHVSPMFGNSDALEKFVEEVGEHGSGIADQGDFCSLVCLVSWADSRLKMRELEA